MDDVDERGLAKTGGAHKWTGPRNTTRGNGARQKPSIHEEKRENRRNVHQQTCLTAGTVTDDDQLAADFGHGCAGSGSGRSRERGVDLLSVDGLL